MASSCCFRRVAARLGFLLKPSVYPELLALGDECDDQFFLRREVPVKGRLAHIRLLDELVHADGVDPPMGEQIGRAVENALSSYRPGMSVRLTHVACAAAYTLTGHASSIKTMLSAYSSLSVILCQSREPLQSERLNCSVSDLIMLLNKS